MLSIRLAQLIVSQAEYENNTKAPAGIKCSCLPPGRFMLS